VGEAVADITMSEEPNAFRKVFQADISGQNNRVHIGDHIGNTVIYQSN
jgi:hypothetical protein